MKHKDKEKKKEERRRRIEKGEVTGEDEVGQSRSDSTSQIRPEPIGRLSAHTQKHTQWILSYTGTCKHRAYIYPLGPWKIHLFSMTQWKMMAMKHSLVDLA